MKRRCCLLALIGVILCLCGVFVSAADYPSPTERFFVNDFAGVIEPEAEDEIFSHAAALYQKTTAQVVVVTVHTLNGEEPADYALNLGREWGIGQKKENNGVVVLLAVSERQIYIAVGYGLEGALPDSKTGRIIDVYGLDDLREGDFSAGLLAISKAVINEIYPEYGQTPEEDYVPIDEIDPSEESSVMDSVISWIILLLIVFLFLRRRRFFRPPFPGSFGGGFFGGGGFSGGSFGGGSSGGGFSGGGGSFGGGGAGRGF